MCTRTLAQWVLPSARLSRKTRVNGISCRFVFPAYENVSNSAISHVTIISVIYCAIVMKNNCDSAKIDAIISATFRCFRRLYERSVSYRKCSAQFVALPIMVCKMIICTLPLHRRTDISIAVLSWKLSMLSSVNHISLKARSSSMHFLNSPLYLYFCYETLHFFINHWYCEYGSPAFKELSILPFGLFTKWLASFALAGERRRSRSRKIAKTEVLYQKSGPLKGPSSR